MPAELSEMSQRPLRDKEILFVEGQPWDGLYKVESGCVEIYRERNGKVVILDAAGPGGLIGTATLLSRKPRMASARARGHSVVSHLPQAPAESLLNSMPPWGRAIIKDVLHHLDATDENFVEAALRVGEAGEAETLPLVPLQKFFEGLCWTQGYRKATYAGKTVEVIPIGDIGAWLGPVMRLPPSKVRAALNALEATRMIRIEEIEGLGPCLLKLSR